MLVPYLKTLVDYRFIIMYRKLLRPNHFLVFYFKVSVILGFFFFAPAGNALPPLFNWLPNELRHCSLELEAAL